MQICAIEPTNKQRCRNEDQLLLTVDALTLKAISAGHYLSRLYRLLGDSKQAYRAAQGRGPAEERARRLHLAWPPDPTHLPTSEEGERMEWENLIEAQAGICAFFSLADNGGPGLHGTKYANTKALRAALLGFRTAFPEPMATEGIMHAFDNAAKTCSDAIMKGLYDGSPQEPDTDLRQELYRNITDAFKVFSQS